MAPSSSPVDSALLALAGAALLFVAWISLAAWMARRFRLDDEELERTTLALPTPGHSAGLTHHPPPENTPYAEPVLVCHGLAVNRFNMDFNEDGRRSDRVSLARALARAGFDVWLLELRGRGRSPCPPGADWCVDDEVNEDVPAAIQAVLDRTGAERLFWVGHSKGSILQYLFQARGHPLAARVAGLVAIGSPGTLRHQRSLRLLVAPGLFLARRVRRIPLRAMATLVLPLSTLIHWVGRHLDAAVEANDGPALRRVLAGLTSDISSGVARQFLGWLASEDGALRTLDGSFDYEQHFHRMALPMLLIAGARDYLAPPASLSHVAERVSSKDVTLRVMSRDAGASRDYGHGDLVVGRHAPDEVFPEVVEWLEARATKREAEADTLSAAS
jgi:predicted alpha/beta hydrolase